MRKFYISIFFISLSINAANPDDEIIKNLDFFQSMELIKDDNQFILAVPPNENETVEKVQ